MAVRKDSKALSMAGATGDRNVAASHPPEAAAGNASEGVAVDDFARLVLGMSRLLTEFNQLKPFREAELGLGDWAVLTMLAQKDGMGQKPMSRILGLPMQRVAEITAALRQDELVSLVPSVQAGKTRRVIKITEAGRARLEAVNAELAAMLATLVGAQPLRGALKRMTLLGRAIRVAAAQET